MMENNKSRNNIPNNMPNFFSTIIPLNLNKTQSGKTIKRARYLRMEILAKNG